MRDVHASIGDGLGKIFAEEKSSNQKIARGKGKVPIIASLVMVDWMVPAKNSKYE